MKRLSAGLFIIPARMWKRIKSVQPIDDFLAHRIGQIDCEYQ